jgi:transposase
LIALGHEVSTKGGGHFMMEADEHKLRVTFVARDGRCRYDPASKERLVSACLEPGVSVSRLALEHGVNANLVRKWVKQWVESRSLPPPSLAAFIPVEIESTPDRSLLRQGGTALVDLPVTCDGGRVPVPTRTAPAFSGAKVSASLPNGVKLTLDCGDVETLTAVIGALGHVQTGR